MNPCGKISLIEGVRYVAIADFIYAILSITVISLQLINSVQNGLAVNMVNISLSDTRITPVLITYLIVSLINAVLAGLLYYGIRTDNLSKCQACLIISILSTTIGLVAVIYHGCQLGDLKLSVFNSEFAISLVYHLYKIYAIFVIASFVRELSKLLTDDDKKVNKRFLYQTLESNFDSMSGEVAKHMIFNIPFSMNHFVFEEKFSIDHEACIEYENNTSTMRGVYQPTSEVSRRSVAIKLLRSNFRTEKHMIALVKEAKLMSHIGHHEHILQFLGICCTSTETCRGNVMLLMESYPSRRLDEFLSNSLDNQLQNFQNHVVNDRVESDKQMSSRRLGTLYENYATNCFDLESFSTVNMIQWAYQLSSAMEYLQSKQIVVGNLQAKSLILIKVSRIKLSNFSLASELHEENNLVTSIFLSGRISWQWTAMECLYATNKGLPTAFNERTDVWSFGSTLWEIFSMGHSPNMSSCLSEYITDLASGRRLPKPKFASEGIYKLMRACWSENASDRPGFKVVSLFFRQLLSTSIEILN